MTQAGDREAVLVTGVYGTGKTSVVEEIADLMEDRGLPYAALDLDWLGWFSTETMAHDGEHRMMLTNLRSVTESYLAAGVRYFSARAYRTE